MIDIISKILPLFLAIVPFFVWLDRSKRFSHRRKFYLNRLEAIKEYLDSYYNSNKEKIEKDCAAQALVCSEKTSHLEVDYVIKVFPQRFFIMIKTLIRARHFIRAIKVDGNIMLIAESSKESYKKKRLLLVGFYFSSILIIPLNDILLYIIKKLGWFSPILVDELLLLIGGGITLIVGCLVALFSGLLFVGVDAAIEVYDDLNVNYVANKD